MEKMNLSQIERQIDLQVREQLKQIRQKLIENIPKSESVGWRLEGRVRWISEKIWHNTGMDYNCQVELGYGGYYIVNINGKFYRIYNNGFLANTEYWNNDVAEYFAKQEGINLSDAHWDVIRFVRKYYDEYKIAPMIKILVKAIGKKLGPEKGNTKYLYELYPGGGMQIVKIAGLPKPCGD